VKFGVVFLVLLLGVALAAAARQRSAMVAAADPGVALNRLLTALTGTPLYVLLVAIAVTILNLQQLLPEHYLVGFLLIPPVGLKLASTGYRFARYYLRDPMYRLAGAPPVLLRFVVAPILVVSTAAVFGTGLELWIFGLRFGSGWMTAHTFSAVFFVAAAALHLLSHFRVSAAATVNQASFASSRETFRLRSLVVGSLLLGAILAAASLLYVTPFPPAAAGG
jgi:hypothetical protein